MKHYLSLGVGMQSTTLFRMACLGLIKPKPEAAVFADPGWERKATYEHLKLLIPFGEEHDIPVITVYNGNIRDDVIDPSKRQPSLPFYINLQRLITIKEQREKAIELIEESYPDGYEYDMKHADGIISQLHVWWDYYQRRKAWEYHKQLELTAFDAGVASGAIKEYWTKPETGMLRRQCTNEYKIRPITKFIKAETNCTRFNPVTQWIGISLDEVQRMKAPRVQYVKFRYPLVEMKMTRDACQRWLEDHGFPIPGRSSCIGCPFHDDEEWASLTEEEFEDACEFDELKRDSGMTHPNREKTFFSDRTYLHRSLIPLREKPFLQKKKDAADQQTLFDIKDEACDSGHCFL